MKKIGILLSGGLDSTILLWKVVTENLTPHEIHIFQFNYGSCHAEKELQASDGIFEIAKEAFKQHVFIKHRINLPFSTWGMESGLLESQRNIPEGHYEDESMKKTVVPFRNGIMLAIACGVLKVGDLYYGGHNGDHAIYADCRKSFVNAMDTCIREGTDNDVNVIAPFVNITKREIAKLGQQLKAPISETWSCYNGEDAHCGLCGTCVERKEALLGFDTTTYRS